MTEMAMYFTAVVRTTIVFLLPLSTFCNAEPRHHLGDRLQRGLAQFRIHQRTS